MATNQELFDLILRVQGQEQVKALTAAVAAGERQLLSMIAAERQAGNAAAATAPQVLAQAAAVKELTGQLRAAEAAQRKMAGTGGSRALLEFSRAAEDAQYGIAGVLNNIPGLITALGGGAGLVGVLSLAAVGFAQVYKNYDSLAGLWGGGHTKTQAEEMEELRKKTSLTADEYERLARADNLAAKGKELRAGKTDAQEAEEKAVTKAITEAGLANVVGMVKQYAPEMLDNSPKVGALDKKIADKQAERDKMQAVAHLDTTGASYTKIGKLDEEIKGLKATRKDVRNEAAENIVATGALPKDWPGNRAKLAAVARKAADADPNRFIELAMGLEDADPQLVKDNALAEARAKRVRERNQRDQAEAKAEQSRLDQEAREGEAQWDKDLRDAQKSKTFLRKNDADMTPAEKEARRLFDEQESKIGEASRNRAWLTPDGLERDDEALTPEEKIAKGRAKDSLRAAKDSDPALGGLLSAAIKGAVQTGEAGSIQEAQAALFGGLADKFGADVARSLLEEAGGAASKGLVSDYVNGRDQMGPADMKILQGNASLRDSIQAEVGKDDLPRKQFEELQRIKQVLEDKLDGGGLG